MDTGTRCAWASRAAASHDIIPRLRLPHFDLGIPSPVQTDGGRTFTEPSVIIAGTVEGCADVPVRVHDACFTSEVLGSLKCDCREQLQLALDFIQHNPPVCGNAEGKPAAGFVANACSLTAR